MAHLSTFEACDFCQIARGWAELLHRVEASIAAIEGIELLLLRLIELLLVEIGSEVGLIVISVVIGFSASDWQFIFGVAVGTMFS